MVSRINPGRIIFRLEVRIIIETKFKIEPQIIVGGTKKRALKAELFMVDIT